MAPASAQLRVRPERKDGGHPALCNAPPQWLRMRHQSHQSHRVVRGDVGVGKMDMGHLCDFDETHRTGSTQDGLHADAAHASLATLHRILLLTQTRTSVLLRATCSGESVRGNVTKGEKSERATNTELPSQTNSNL